MISSPKTNKRLWIAGLIGLVTITGAYLYFQVNKILTYTLKFKGVKNAKLEDGGVSFTMWYIYRNTADISITLTDQKYDVFINNQYLTTLGNFVPNTLVGGVDSNIEINAKITKADFKKLKFNYADLFLSPKSPEIKTIMKWKVKYGIFNIPITYAYTITLKEIISGFTPAKV